MSIEKSKCVIVNFSIEITLIINNKEKICIRK